MAGRCEAYWEKNLWIAAYMMVGALHSCTVGEVESNHRKEVPPRPRRVRGLNLPRFACVEDFSPLTN